MCTDTIQRRAALCSCAPGRKDGPRAKLQPLEKRQNIRLFYWFCVEVFCSRMPTTQLLSSLQHKGREPRVGMWCGNFITNEKIASGGFKENYISLSELPGFRKSKGLGWNRMWKLLLCFREEKRKPLCWDLLYTIYGCDLWNLAELYSPEREFRIKTWVFRVSVAPYNIQYLLCSGVMLSWFSLGNSLWLTIFFSFFFF